MNGMQTYIKFVVHSDLNDELVYAEFDSKKEAIRYARDYSNEFTYVDKVECFLDPETGRIDEIVSSTTVWTYLDESLEDPQPSTEEEDYWDMMIATDEAEEQNKYDSEDTTWFESLDNLVEDMEENEDIVECKECFDLFPKADCVKLAFGYICPTCNHGSEVADSDIFKIDFPEYEKFSGPEEEYPTVEVENEPETAEPEMENENDPISIPEEAVPFLVNDEVEAVAGYEKAAEVVADSDLENKEKILDTIDHIKEEEEEHIEELQDLIPEEKDDEIIEVENDPISDNSADTDEVLVEDISDDDLEAEIEKAKKTLELAKLNAKIEKQKTKSSKQVAKQAKSELSATKSANKATKDTSSTNVAVSNDEVKVSKNDVKVSKNDLKKTKVDNKQQELQHKQDSEESEVEETAETKYWLCKYDDNNITILNAPTEAEAKEKFKTNYKDRYTFNACEWGVTEITKEEAAKYTDNKVTEGLGGNIFTGAATGASLGSLLGPGGGVAGAAVGAVSGLVKSLFNAAGSLAKTISDKSKIKNALKDDPELKDTIEKIKEETGESDTEKILTWIEDYYKQKVFNNVGDVFDEFNNEAEEVEVPTIDVDDELVEHINNRAESIESDQELEGTDNAVVDCKVADVVTHSEDEKPVDCEGKKKPLEKPLTEGFTFSLNNEKDLAEFTKLCQEVGIKTIGDLDRFTKETADGSGNVLDKLRAYRKELGDDFQIKESLYNFTEEEMAEYNMDEDGISLDSYDEYVRCNWCGEVFTVDQCIFEANMGWLCDRCEAAIRSRGEKLTILTNPTDDEIVATLTEAKKMTRDEMVAKEGTDDVDLINAGREEEDRVEIVD